MKSNEVPAQRGTAGSKRAARLSPEERRNQLLATAVHVFADKGIGQAVHKDLAAASGVSVATTFHYFPTRQDLVDSVLQEVGRFLIEDFVEPRVAVSDELGAEAIRSMIISFSEAIDDFEQYVHVWMQWSAAAKQDCWAAYKVFHGATVSKIGELVARGIQDGSVGERVRPELAGEMIMGCARVVAQMKFSGDSNIQILELVDSFVSGYLSGGVAKDL